MNTNDLLLRWSNLSLDQIEEEIRSGKDSDSAVELLGPETVAEMQAISFAPASFGSREPVVLLPGIMGSLLTSIRGVTTLLWINPLLFVQGNARYLRLDPTGTVDECQEIEVSPLALEKMTYLKIGLALNREAQLFEFPYDWRRNVVYNAERLHKSIERWAGQGNRKVTLVAHSMGGLVSRAYMALHPKAAEKRVKKLVMLGTPNFGATNAVDTLLHGNSLMGTVDRLNKENGMIDVVRSLPGIYNLLPAPSDCFPSGANYPADWDLYDAAVWENPAISQTHLDSSRKFHQLLASSDPQISRVMIAGCHLDTLVGLNKAVSFIPKRVELGEESGDGTVPLWSARLKGTDMFYIQEKHSDLPNNRQVINASINLIHDETPNLSTSLPEPKTGGFLGLSFDVPPTAAELEAKIRAGEASKEDLKQLYFAL